MLARLPIATQVRVVSGRPPFLEVFAESNGDQVTGFVHQDLLAARTPVPQYIVAAAKVQRESSPLLATTLL